MIGIGKHIKCVGCGSHVTESSDVDKRVYDKCLTVIIEFQEDT